MLNKTHSTAQAINGKLMQLGFVTTNYHSAKLKLQSIYGINDFFLFEDIQFFDTVDTNGPVTCRANIAIGYSGDLQIEILEPLPDDQLYTQITKTPQSMLHHIGFQVENLQAALNYHTKKGQKILARGTIGSQAEIKFAFIDSIDEVGFLTELLEFGPGIQKIYSRLKARFNKKMDL